MSQEERSSLRAKVEMWDFESVFFFEAVKRGFDFRVGFKIEFNCLV